MTQKQKDAILSLVRTQQDNKDFANSYVLPYLDFLDRTNAFTDFDCERLEGKDAYLFLIKQLLLTDAHAQVFVSVYGFEEDEDDLFIDGDTLIVFSSLPLFRIQELFNQSKDSIPSKIGEIIDFDEKTILVDQDGTQCPAKAVCKANDHVYYCWWD